MTIEIVPEQIYYVCNGFKEKIKDSNKKGWAEITIEIFGSSIPRRLHLCEPCYLDSDFIERE